MISIALIAGTVGDAIFVVDYTNQVIYMSSTSPLDTTLVSLPFQNISSPYGIAFNSLEDRIYWTDWNRDVIMRSTIDGKNQEIIHSSVFRPSGIALDLVGGNIYWISNNGHTIEVSKLNGDYWKVLVSNLRNTPVDITLDTSRGYVQTVCVSDTFIITIVIALSSSRG